MSKLALLSFGLGLVAIISGVFLLASMQEVFGFAFLVCAGLALVLGIISRILIACNKDRRGKRWANWSIGLPIVGFLAVIFTVPAT